MIDSNALWALTERLRQTTPMVQCITNFVAMDVSANVLLAAGASPAMIHDPEEAAEFAALGGTLLVNIGTPSPRWRDGMVAAARACHDAGGRWALDPVAAGATGFRNRILADLLPLKPAIIRGNAGEIMALAGDEKVKVTSPDSSRASSEAHSAAVALARRQGCTVAVTGVDDIITDGRRRVVLGNGHLLMTKVTALGCALSALNAAYLGITDDTLAAAAAACAYFGVCGEIAAEGSAGPGTLRVRLLDALYGLDYDSYRSRLKLTLGDVQS